MQNLALKMNNYFGIAKNNSTFKKEIIGGLTTFLAMIYILSVNPSILSISAGEEFQGAIFLGTAISSFVATMFMGLYAKIPLALAPGMGINAFLTFTVASTFGLGYSGALIAVFFSGILYAIVSLTNIRKILIKWLPDNFKITVTVLIGFFIGYIGLQDMGIIAGSPATLTQLGHLQNPLVIIGLITLLIIFALYFTKIQGSVVIGMIAGVIMLAIAFAFAQNNEAAWAKDLKNAFVLNSYGDFDKFGTASKSMWESLVPTLKNPLLYVAIFTFFYVDFFDTTGTLLVFEKLFQKQQNNNWIRKANVVDGFSTVVGAVLLNSSVTSFVESTSGFKAGARTGLASVVTSILFLASIALWPILRPFLPIGNIKPITGPVLVLISVLIVKELKYFDWKRSQDIPVLMTGVFMGTLGFSISLGFAFAAIVYTFMYLMVNPIIQIKKNAQKFNYANYKTFASKEFNIVMLSLFLISVIYIILHVLNDAGLITAG